MKQIKAWVKKHFTYSYEELTETVRKGESIQATINEISKGTIGHVRVITKRRWPWQQPDTSQRKVILVQPGEYTESMTIEADYITLVGSAYLKSRIIVPKDVSGAIRVIKGIGITIKELFIDTNK